MRETQNIPLMKAFAVELKAQRNARGLSQEELALACQVNRTFVAKIELARNQPSLSVLLKLSQGLEIPLPEMLRKTMERYSREVGQSV